jgi:hypothetical protein
MGKELVITQKQIENRIFTIRGIQVMFDSDIAEMYDITTSRLNEQVKRNLDRFPPDFMFQLTAAEWETLKPQFEGSSLRSQNAILENNRGKHRKYLPSVFTEQGVAGLSGVLKSETAAQIHVAIMRAFIAMRKFILDNQLIYSRLDKIEQKQLQTDQKFEQIFKALEQKSLIPNQGVFFNGQVFDAYELASKIIRSAKASIILIDNYIDENTITHLTKKKKNVKVLLLTNTVSRQLNLDIQKANQQYGIFEVKQFTQSHDRFLIIDNGVEVYHIGASLKDLGKKWFAFSKMDKSSVIGIIKSVSGLI